MDALHKKTDQIEANVSLFENKLEALNAKLAGLEHKTSDLEERLVTQEKTMQEVSEAQKEAHLSSLASTKSLMRLERRMEAAENMLQECHIRVLGIPAQAEGEDPATFMFTFLANLLEIDAESDSFYVVKAFQLQSRHPTKGEPSAETMLVVLSDVSERGRLLALARKKKVVTYKENRILLFPEVSPLAQVWKLELLALRKELAAKDIEASVVYPAKLRVRQGDKTFIFSDVASAKAFAEKLRVPEALAWFIHYGVFLMLFCGVGLFPLQLLFSG